MMPLYDPDAATARADLCRFLSACYYEPDPVFSEERLFDNMQIAATRIHPDLPEYARKLGAAFAACDLQTLLVDYTRLFLGPMTPLARPYGASWLKMPINPEDNPHAAILATYNAGGFEMDAEFQELPDHIAVELEFLYALLFEDNPAYEALQQQFLSNHLGVWIGPFAAAVKEHAQTAFYAALAEFTEKFVDSISSGRGHTASGSSALAS